MKKILLISLLLCGCAHVKCGPCEYWRLGTQEVAEARIIAPDGTTVVLSGLRAGENVKPSLTDLVGACE